MENTGETPLGGTGATTTYSGVVSGTGALTKIGTGTFTLTGNNTYTGTTDVEAGTLMLGTGGSVGALVGGNIILNGNGTLVFNRNNTATLAGVISGNGTLTTLGTGTLTLTGNNTSFNGTVNIQNGQISVDGTGYLAVSDSTVWLNGGNLSLGTLSAATLGGVLGSGNLSYGATSLTIGANGATTTYSGVLSGSGSFTKIGNGTLTLSGNNTYSGSTSVNNGMLVLTGSNGNGTISIADGATLQVGNGNATGSLGTGNVTDNGTLIFNRSDYVVEIPNNISGSGNLTQMGAGNIYLEGVNSYNATTIMTGAGALAVEPGSSLGTGAVVNNSQLAIFTSDATTVTNDISGSGFLFVDGTGAFTFSGDYSATGGMQIGGGIGSGGVSVLFTGDVNASMTTVIWIADSSDSLEFDGTLNLSAHINLGGDLTIRTSGTDTLAASFSGSANFYFWGGTLSFTGTLPVNTFVESGTIT